MWEHQVGGGEQSCALSGPFREGPSHSVPQTSGSASGSDVCGTAGSLWDVCEMPDMFVICICQLYLEIDARRETKSKGSYSVAQCVIALSHSPFFSLEVTVLISNNVIYLWENKNHLCSVVYFLEHV